MNAGPADPRELAARPAFVPLLAALRGGEGPCPGCEGKGRLLVRDHHAERPNRYTKRLPRGWAGCKSCKGSGRVAVPPPAAGFLAGLREHPGDRGISGMFADWLEETAPGAGLTALLCWYAADAGGWEDANAVLAAWDDARGCPARAAAVRGHELMAGSGAYDPQHPFSGYWRLSHPPDARHSVGGFYRTEREARLALKAAVLHCYDPGNPYDGGVLVPVRAEGARLTVRRFPGGLEQEWARDALPSGVCVTPADLAYEYRLDGARVGAPPGWGWTPHRAACGECEGTGKWCRPKQCATDMHRCGACGGSGYRLAVEWECRPSDLLPAGDEAAEQRARAADAVARRAWGR